MQRNHIRTFVLVAFTAMFLYLGFQINAQAAPPIFIKPPQVPPPINIDPPQTLPPTYVLPPVLTKLTPVISPKDRPPKNMQELAKMIFALYSKDANGNYTPIRIVQTGQNEYLLMIAGTRSSWQVANDWISAIASGYNLPGDYYKQIKSIVMELPKGAVVNCAGHSQGGMMCNQLAVDPEVIEHISMKTVTTFGSPVNAKQNMEVIYNRIATVNDWVPWLKPKESNDFFDLFGFPLVDNPIYEILTSEQQFIPGSFNPIIAHGMYPDSEDLKKVDLSFVINQWGNSTSYSANDSTLKQFVDGLDRSIKYSQKEIYEHIISPVRQLLELKPEAAPYWLGQGIRMTPLIGGGLGVAAQAGLILTVL